MMPRSEPFMRIAGLGAICGLRSLSGPALLASRLQRRPPQRWPHPALRRLATEPVPSVIQVLASGELIADKLPFLPPRTSPLSLAPRAASGAAVGATLAAVEGRSWLAGAAIGCAAAVLAAFAGYETRRRLTGKGRLPDLLVALLEDGIVLGVGKRLAL